MFAAARTFEPEPESEPVEDTPVEEPDVPDFE